MTGTTGRARPVAGTPRDRYRAGMTDTAALQQSPLGSFHVEQGAKMVPYAGWELPLHYGSIAEEHLWTRSSGGLFDVSHMGRLRVSGRHARRFLDRVCTRLVRGMEPGQCRYSLICNEQGGCLDDVLVYCFGADDYLVVCNGANRPKIVEHFERVKAEESLEFKLDDQTVSTCMVAIQGPKVMDLIGGVAVAESEFNGSVYFMFNSSGCITEPVDFVAGGTCEEQLMGMAETLWEPGMGPDQLFECISQAMMNAFDRDAISGWGAIVHIIEKDKVTQLDSSTNVLSSDLIFQVTTRTLKTRMD